MELPLFGNMKIPAIFGAIGLVGVLILFVFLFNIAGTEKLGKMQVLAVIPLTGPTAPIGEDFLKGMELAMEKHDMGFELVLEDSQSQAKAAVTAAKKALETRKVDVVVSLQSSVAVPLVALAEEHNKPLLATVVSNDGFAKSSRNAFRLFPNGSESAALAAGFAHSQGFGNASTITIMDEYGQTMRDEFVKNFPGVIDAQESFEAGNQDFRTALLKTRDSEAVYFIGLASHYASFLRQREETGAGTIVISNQDLVSEFTKSNVGTLLDNAFATVPVSMVGNERTEEFSKEFEVKFGRKPDFGAMFGYDMALVLDAVEKSGKNPMEALHEIEVDGLNGTLSFDEDGEVDIELAVVEASDGIVEKVDFEQGEGADQGLGEEGEGQGTEGGEISED